MTYAELYKQQLAAGKVRSVEPDFVKLAAPGDNLIGRLLGTETVKAKGGSGTFLAYIFETDQGFVKTKCGAATDNKIKNGLRIGAIYSVTFLGQTKLSDTQVTNNFRWEEIAEPEEPFNGEETHTLRSAVQE